MALTPSTMLPLGTPAPAFALPEPLQGRLRTLSEVRGVAGTVVMFLCNHCPYVVHVNPELVRVATEYGPRGIGFVAISANDAEAYPQDGPAAMAEAARRLAYPFPYLYDETQDVARAYQAACTPDFYVFDSGLACVYRGRLDASTPGNGQPLTGADLRAALEALLAGVAPALAQQPSVGCNIKWRRPGSAR